MTRKYYTLHINCANCDTNQPVKIPCGNLLEEEDWICINCECSQKKIKDLRASLALQNAASPLEIIKENKEDDKSDF